MRHIRRVVRGRQFNLPRMDAGFLAKLIFFGIVGGSLLMAGAFIWYSKDLPDPNTIARKQGFSTQLLDRESKEVLYDVYEDENRQFTSLNDIPQTLKQATIAIEDKEFYKHNGFDALGTVRGMLRIFTRGRAAGGSTLTQQLVKNVLLTNERSVARKIKELVLAVQIERKFSKDEILQMYLNEAPYGGTAWGISAASQQYFGKKPQDLTLMEVIILAGMPQAPSSYSPYGKNPLAYVNRATNVARRMREDGHITKEQEKEVVDNLTTVSFKQQGTGIKAPHFVMYVKDLLEQMYGEDIVTTGGLKVTTTLDWELQDKAQQIVSEEINKVAGPIHITNGASIIINPQNGEILSMVGSRDFFDKEGDGQVNVTLSKRQPGSSIKPVTYATAFKKGFWPGKVIADVVTDFPSGDPTKEAYRPENYDGKEHGLVHLRDALGSSLNVPAVKLLALVGVKDTLTTAFEMGLTTLEPSGDNLRRLGLSLALGGGEVRLIDMASAYSAFANGGFKAEPVSILKVEDRNGKVLYEAKSVGKKKVLDEKIAFLVNSILSDNKARLITFGPSSLLNISGRNVAVKTGTTNDRRDNWAIGWTTKAVVGVWVGNNDNSQMKSVASGVSGASPIWRRQMMDTITKFGDEAFNPPAGVEQVDLDLISGYAAHDNFAAYKEWIIKGSLPSEADPIHKNLEVCKGEGGKLATMVQIAQGNFDRAEYIFVREADPLTPDNKWQIAIDEWLKKQTDSKYHPPAEFCGSVTGVHVEITTPANEGRVDQNEVNIKATVISDKKVIWVDLYIDGNKERRWDNGPYEATYTLDTGIHEIRIVGHNEDNVESDRVYRFGVKVDYASPTSAPTPTVTPTPTPV